MTESPSRAGVSQCTSTALSRGSIPSTKTGHTGAIVYIIVTSICYRTLHTFVLDTLTKEQFFFQSMQIGQNKKCFSRCITKLFKTSVISVWSIRYITWWQKDDLDVSSWICSGVASGYRIECLFFSGSGCPVTVSLKGTPGSSTGIYQNNSKMGFLTWY